jgi:hypothetical protein
VSEPIPGTPPEKKSSFGCLKILIIMAGIVALILLIFGIMVWNAISWFKDAPEPKAAVYAPLQLSLGEQEDVTRVVSEIYATTRTGEDIDESITPQVLNGVLEKIIEDDRKTNKTSDPPSFVRFAVANNAIQIKASVPFKDQENGSIQKTPEGQVMYVNAEAELRLEIENSIVTQVEIQSLKLHDRPAPFLFRAIFYHDFTDKLKSGHQPTQTNSKNPNNVNVDIFKTLKIENGRLHIVLDGKKIKENEEKKKAKASGAEKGGGAEKGPEDEKKDAK